jgi:hypothetical protein
MLRGRTKSAGGDGEEVIVARCDAFDAVGTIGGIPSEGKLTWPATLPACRAEGGGDGLDDPAVTVGPEHAVTSRATRAVVDATA